MNDTLAVKPSTTITPSGTDISFPRQAGGSPTLALRGVSNDATITTGERVLRIGHTVTKGQIRSLAGLDTAQPDVDNNGLAIYPARERSFNFTLSRPISGVTYAQVEQDFVLMVNFMSASSFANLKAWFNKEL